MISGSEAPKVINPNKAPRYDDRDILETIHPHPKSFDPNANETEITEPVIVKNTTDNSSITEEDIKE